MKFNDGWAPVGVSTLENLRNRIAAQSEPKAAAKKTAKRRRTPCEETGAPACSCLLTSLQRPLRLRFLPRFCPTRPNCAHVASGAPAIVSMVRPQFCSCLSGADVAITLSILRL